MIKNLILIILFLFSSSVFSNSLEEVQIHSANQIVSKLGPYTELINMVEEESYYLPTEVSLTGGKFIPKDQQERIELLEKRLAYPISEKLEDEEMLHFLVKQTETASRISTYTGVLGEITRDLSSEQERRYQLGEHMLSYKTDKFGRRLNSPIESLREDTQVFNFLLSRGLLGKQEELLLSRIGLILTQTLTIFAQQGNISYPLLRAISSEEGEEKE